MGGSSEGAKICWHSNLNCQLPTVNCQLSTVNCQHSDCQFQTECRPIKILSLREHIAGIIIGIPSRIIWISGGFWHTIYTVPNRYHWSAPVLFSSINIISRWNYFVLKSRTFICSSGTDFEKRRKMCTTHFSNQRQKHKLAFTTFS